MMSTSNQPPAPKPKALIPFKSEQDLKVVLAKEYMKQIENLFGDHDLALEFLTNVVASAQRVPKLLDCAPETLLNSFMIMASLKLMPSGISGEAYVLPYENKKKGIVEAQFQLGYQGLVTLFYRAGIRSIVAEIVRKNDGFSYENGEVRHVVDPFSDNRGEALGAYVILELPTGGKISKVMSKKEIIEIAQKFSKSYSGFGPWSEGQDPQLWMWRKTVLKQAAKLAPKNPELNKAIAEDNKDSVIGDRPQTSANDLIEPPADYTAYESALRACKTMPELERVWADMPGDGKAALRPVMEEMKAILLDAANDNV